MADHNRAREGWLQSRPDQVALWALALALVVLIAAAVSAQASSGGVGPSSGGVSAETDDQSGDAPAEASPCRPNARFGARVLRRPDCGNDARTLNWILRSKAFHRDVPLAQRFSQRTAATVRVFQRRSNLPVNGVLREASRKRLIQSMARHKATWYGPGFFGNRTACGQTLRRATRGVAHKTLPCGTRVVIGHAGRFVRTRVIDRGPYAHGARWDLTQKVARELRFEGVNMVRVARVR